MVGVALNQTSFRMSARDVAQDAASMAWIERLFMNLLSYLIVIVPIGITVIATRCKLFPQTIRSNTLVQWFVYGAKSTKPELDANHDSDARCLLNVSDQISSRQPRPQPYNIRDNALEFIWCLLGLQVSYLIWGLLQERIMTTSYPINMRTETLVNRSTNDQNKHLALQSSGADPLTKEVTFHDSQFLVFINRLVAFITAILAMVFMRRRNLRNSANRFPDSGDTKLIYIPTRSPRPQAPLYKYIYCSLSNILSSWSQYEALKYVNFPTQCLSKSCKVIPVMLMSRILLRQRHPSSDYFCALLLALGMFIFLLGQPIDSKHRDLKDGSFQSNPERNNGVTSGLLILGLYLTFDSFTSNWQQSLYSQYDISNWQMMAAINFYSILLTLTSLHQLGGLRPALELLASSSSLAIDCLAMSVMSSIGQMFVYYTIKRFGSVLFAVIMTLRQFLSILISITVFNHQTSLWSISGLVLVFSVAGYQVYHKSKRSAEKKSSDHCLSRGRAQVVEPPWHNKSSQEMRYGFCGTEYIANSKSDPSFR